ncbi:hypothetical protein PSTT_08250 [Puccinia striiformis]|uniref:Uncharacterized protein n=1 Tax=Puccinia striiformis TaxID=27350 RepID=A0A2S4VD69_9BASI|nr:hypothetical protein PSTT_08250 [Puccinia striiformis]
MKMVKPLTTLTTLSIFLPQVFSHSFIIALDGANGVQSSGFGTRLTTRGQVHQYTGIITDKEIKAGTVGPCGRIFGGDNFTPFVVDPNAELARAEKSGVSTVHQDGSIVMGVFVHNPDGSGPFKCDYSPDSSLSKFEPMNITVQIEGVDGVNPAAQNYVYPLTAAFYPNATCTGGKGKDTCIVRCRNQLGFGSCAALKLGEAAKRIKPPPPASNANSTNQTVSVPKNTTNNAAPLPPHPHEPVNQTNPIKAPVAPAPAPTAPVPAPPVAPASTAPVPAPPVAPAPINPVPAPAPAAGPKPALIQEQPSQTTVGPNPDAFRIYNSGAPAIPEPGPVTAENQVFNANGLSNLPPPHDPNYNALTADLPSSPAPAVVERRSLSKTKRLFLHKRPRRHF